MISIQHLRASAVLIVLAVSQFGTGQAVKKPGELKDLRRLRETIARWNDAFRRLDAKSLAALETAEVEIVDRFGELHQLTAGCEKVAFWADGFAVIAKESTPPELAVGQIRLVGAAAATVKACTHFRNGIKLEDGARIPPLWELNSYLLLKRNGEWKIAEISIHDQTPPEGCVAAIE
jgi:hypothetical protein